MRATLFHNPTAGDAPATAERLQAILADAGYQVRYQSTDDDWESALDDIGDLAVVAGGDGTVAKLFKALAETGVRIALLPFGTANNIGKTLGVFGDVESLVRAWHDAPERAMDVGVVSGPWGEDRFVEAVGGGVFADLIRRGEEEVDDTSTIVGRETDRALHLLRSILDDAEAVPWRIELDSFDLSGEYLAVEAMNVGFAGPNIPLATEGDVGDGRIDVVLVREEDRDRLRRYVTDRLEEASSRMPSLDVRSGRHLRMTPAAPVTVHVDDALVPAEAAGDDDPVIDVLVRPGALRIVDAGTDAPGGGATARP